MFEETEFAGNYEDQFEIEFNKAVALLVDGFKPVASSLFNQIAARARVIEVPDDPIEAIKSRAIKDAMRAVLTEYTLAFKEIGIDISGKVPDNKMLKALATRAKKRISNN